jgi:pilus assembly protein CpaC
VELESGQSFVIAGLLDNQMTENFAKVPGIGSIPVLGKLFQNKQVTRNNSELMVIITPEVVRPIPTGQPVPELKLPQPMMPSNSGIPMSTPGLDKTGPVPVKPPFDSMPIEDLMPKQGQSPVAAPAMYQMIPVPPVAPNAGANQGSAPSQAAASPGGSSK